MFAIIILTLLPIGWAYFEAKLDSSKILKNINITHFPSIIFRVIGSLIQSLIFYPFLSPYFILSVIYQLSIFWIAFEVILNKLRGLHYLYIGSTSKGDKFIRKHFTIVQFFVLKLSILLTTILIWIFLELR